MIKIEHQDGVIFASKNDLLIECFEYDKKDDGQRIRVRHSNSDIFPGSLFLSNEQYEKLITQLEKL